MIRLSLLWLLVAFLSVYAFRDWFKSLCGLILLIAVVEHPDFPKSLMGVQGLNAWNVLLAFVLLAWIANRDRNENPWDLPGNYSKLLIVYFSIVILSFVRMAADLEPYVEFRILQRIEPESFGGLFSEHIVNSLKWVIPGILLFDACRSESRMRWGVACTVGIYLLLAIQVIRWMPLSAFGGGEGLEERASKILANEIGYNRVNLSMLLAGGSWALFAARDMFRSGRAQMFVTFLSVVVFFGMALTGGRMGYVTWALIGLLFGALRWRRIFIYGPVALGFMIFLVPAVQERLFQGFDAESVESNDRIEEHSFRDENSPDLYTITSGRTFAWPWVISKIGERPLVGHGKEGMIRSGLAATLWLDYGESFPHPHNAYLQWLLDNGIIGFIPVFIFYFLIMKMAIGTFRSDTHDLSSAIAGIVVALLTALLIGSMGSQSFYPREGAVGMWCAIGLLLRVIVQKNSAMVASRSTGLKRTFTASHSY